MNMQIRLAIAQWLPQYKLAWLKADLMSGANVWAVLIPTGLAYAGLVGVDPLVGLYCVPAALLGYAIFGGSRLLVVGPDASVAILSGGVIAAVGVGSNNLQLAIILSILVGIVYVGFAFLRLGWVSDLIPDPVLKGFVEGLVWVTILKQVVKLLGLEIDGEAKRFLPKLYEIIQALPQAHIVTAAVGIFSLLSLFLINRFFHRLPSAFIVLLASIVLVGLFGLDHQGVAVVDVTKGGIPEIEGSIGSHLGQIVDMLPGAVAIVVIGFTLSIAAAKRAAEKTGERIDPNQELFAVGVANFGSGGMGGYPIAGTLSKTAVAMESGGRSQLGNVFTGLLGVLTILFLVPFLGMLAYATLAALVIVVMLEVSDLPYFLRLWRVRRQECVIGAFAFAGVLAYGALPGVMIGAFLALVVLADHISRPPTITIGRTQNGDFTSLEDEQGARPIPGMVIWRQYAPLVFLNARRLSNDIRSRVEEQEGISVVLLDGMATSGVDATGTSAFLALRDDLAKDGVTLWVANVRNASWNRIVAALSATDTPIPPYFNSLADAVDEFEKSGPAAVGPGTS